MKKSVLPVILLLSFCLICAAVMERRAHPAMEQDSFFAMDTYMTFTVYGEGAEKALPMARERLTELENLWSVTQKDSEIYRLDHSAGRTVRVSQETADLLAYTLQMAQRTEGALDPTVYPVLKAWGFTTGENTIPSPQEILKLLPRVEYEKVKLDGLTVSLPEGVMLDVGAVAKGYAGDELAELLRKEGIVSALLDIGGNIQAIGEKPGGGNWQIGLKDPALEGIVGILQVSDQAVVTSGNYERFFVGEDGRTYGHIIDPDTGYPVENDLLSVTVVARQGKMCDALSTALFVMGSRKAREHWQDHKDFDMILITKENRVYITEGIADRFTLDETHDAWEIQVIKSSGS